MMSDLLLEIYGEELPSSAQILGERQLYQSFLELLEKQKIVYSSIKTFSTSRRISIVIKQISKKEKDSSVEIRGPSTGADKRALMGFMKSNDILHKTKTKTGTNPKIDVFTIGFLIFGLSSISSSFLLS